MTASKPTRITKKAIINAISLKFGFKPEYLSLIKIGGEYYWDGKLSAILNNTEENNYVVRLNDISLQDWIANFEHRLAKEFGADEFTSVDLNAKVEAIDWNVEYDQSVLEAL